MDPTENATALLSRAHNRLSSWRRSVRTTLTRAKYMWRMPSLSFTCGFSADQWAGSCALADSAHSVIGSQSQSKREEFQAALQFTEAYSLLAVSVEDRPFIPVSSVILGGAPREFKALFRTWDDAKTPTQWQPARKPSLRLIGLPQAMEAMSH